MKKASMKIPTHVPTAVDLAWFLSMNRLTVLRLEKKNILRRTARGYDLRENFASYVAYKESNVAKQHGQGAYGEGRAKLITERAIMARIQREKMEQSVIDAEAVTERWSQTCAAIKTRFLASPSKLARQLASASEPSECARILGDEIDENLETLARGEFIVSKTKR
jgi:phage terminase Nu1 subunit (DNA packaging protein)